MAARVSGIHRIDSGAPRRRELSDVRALLAWWRPEIGVGLGTVKRAVP